MYNPSIKKCIFAQKFQLVIVISSFKGENSTDINNYRPISMIDWWLISNNFAKNYQKPIHKIPKSVQINLKILIRF